MGHRDADKTPLPPALYQEGLRRETGRTLAWQRKLAIARSRRITRLATMKRMPWLIGLCVLLLPLAAAYAQTLGNGDVNGDGVVDNADLQAVIRSWDTTSHAADQYGDGFVNGMDYTLVKGKIAAQVPQTGEWVQF